MRILCLAFTSLQRLFSPVCVVTSFTIFCNGNFTNTQKKSNQISYDHKYHLFCPFNMNSSNLGSLPIVTRAILGDEDQACSVESFLHHPYQLSFQELNQKVSLPQLSASL